MSEARCPDIQHALEAVKADGATCLSCLQIGPEDEPGLLSLAAAHGLPSVRIAQGRCIKCGNATRVVRKVQQGTPMPRTVNYN